MNETILRIVCLNNRMREELRCNFKFWMENQEDSAFLHEAVNDEAYAFRAVFMAGGPGSGKSFVAKQMFAGLGFKFCNSDSILELLARTQNVSLNAPEDSPEYERYLDLMNKSMNKSQQRSNYWMDQGHPLVIDITGRDVNLVQSISERLKPIGYDVGMVYVRTPLPVAMRRNSQRDRSVPDEYLVKANQEALTNIPIYSKMFGSRFVVVENDRDHTPQELKMQVIPDLHRMALRAVGRPYECQNPVGRDKLHAEIPSGGRVKFKPIVPAQKLPQMGLSA